MTFSRYYRNDYYTLEEAIDFLWGRNLINVGEMAEQAIAKQGKKKQTTKGKKGFDFEDDKSDSKYVTVSYYKTSAYACIGGIENKIGLLRVLAHEPKQNKNYFFKIPYSVYEPYTKYRDSLKIYFDIEGNPRKPARSNIRYDLWDYRCTKKEWVI